MELRECPFCGGKAKYSKDNIKIRNVPERVAWVYCLSCRSRTTYMLRSRYQERYGAVAVDAWNRRAE